MDRGLVLLVRNDKIPYSFVESGHVANANLLYLYGSSVGVSHAFAFTARADLLLLQVDSKRPIEE